MEAGDEVLKNPENEEEEAMKAQILKRMGSNPGWFTEAKNSLKGVSEETTTGVLRLHQMSEKGARVEAYCPEQEAPREG
jgi:adenosylhomocysteinase